MQTLSCLVSSRVEVCNLTQFCHLCAAFGVCCNDSICCSRHLTDLLLLSINLIRKIYLAIEAESIACYWRWCCNVHQSNVCKAVNNLSLRHVGCYDVECVCMQTRVLYVVTFIITLQLCN